MELLDLYHTNTKLQLSQQTNRDPGSGDPRRIRLSRSGGPQADNPLTDVRFVLSPCAPGGWCAVCSDTRPSNITAPSLRVLRPGTQIPYLLFRHVYVRRIINGNKHKLALLLTRYGQY